MTRTRTQTKRDKDVLSVHKPFDFGAMPTYSFKFVLSGDVEILDCNEKITDSIFIGLGDIHQGRVEVQRSVFDDEVLHDVPLTSMEIEAERGIKEHSEHSECVKPMLIETVEDEVTCESVDEQCASQQERILELERENEELRKRLEQLQDETCFWMLRG